MEQLDSIVLSSNDGNWLEIRRIRDALIGQTDWTQMPDAPLSDEKKAEFATYRQALRDIPQNSDKANSVIFPAKPTI